MAHDVHPQARTFWPLAAYPEVEVLRFSLGTAPWCALEDSIAACLVGEGSEVDALCSSRIHTRSRERMMVVMPGGLHADLAPRTPTTTLVVRIPGALLPACAMGPSLRGRASDVDAPPVVESFREFHELTEVGAGPEAQAVFERCLALLIEELTPLAARERREDHVAVRRARAYMDEHHRRALMLDEIAAFARISKFQLVNLFTQQMGCPPHRYLIHVRVCHARRLLARGAPCSRVAYEVGFCDQSHLNRWFGKLVGTSPGLYRERRLAQR